MAHLWEELLSRRLSSTLKAFVYFVLFLILPMSMSITCMHKTSRKSGQGPQAEVRVRKASDEGRQSRWCRGDRHVPSVQGGAQPETCGSEVD